MRAPNFTLPDQAGKMHTLKDYRAQWVLVYFYPRDDTPGCTKEACTFRDMSAEFKKNNIAILGISKDSVASHKKFADKYHITFPILSDESKEVHMAYKAWGPKKFMGKEYDGTLRNSYLINPRGEIVHIFKGVKPLTHPLEVLKYPRA